MALQSLGSPIAWPSALKVNNNTPSLGTIVTLDAAGEYAGFVFLAREAMTISTVGFRPGATSGSPTLDIRIETVDPATGLPNGLWAANTNKVAAVPVAGTWQLETLTASASVSAGQIFCVKFLYGGTGSTIIQGLSGTLHQTVMPYRVDNIGTPTTGIFSTGAVIAVGSSSTAFYKLPGVYPISAVVSNNTFNNTNSQKRGLKFQVPFKCRAVGARYFMNAATGDFNIVLEDTSPAELSSSSTAFDTSTLPAVVTGAADLYFDNAVTLSPATDYRLMVEPTSATNCNITTFTLPSADYRSAWPHGTNCLYTTFASAAYSDTATNQLPFLELLIDQLDDGVGSGGGMVRHPGMSGGVNG